MAKIGLFPKDPTILKLRKEMAQPTFVPPMLATLTEDYFSNKDWIFEQKYDGERCLAFKHDGKVVLKSRNKKIINDKYPDLVKALTQQSADNFIIDGEIVALNKKGVSDFQLLQGRINLSNQTEISEKERLIPIRYCIFDIMYVDHYDIRKLPLLARKKILRNLLQYTSKLVYSTHRASKGLEFFKQACKNHWEGLIAKHAQSTYVGVRSRNWLKFKCVMEQELVIIGYTSPQGSRTDFGALLVGYYKDKKLLYAGKVGTGYDVKTLKMLGAKLRKLHTDRCPVSNYDESSRNVHWVRPILVAEFKFAEWTKANRLRVPRYLGLRDDKKAKNVVKET